MSELENIYVKKGLWTNWSYGPVMGKTITTDIQLGTVIVSLLAILSALATTHLWNLITFAVHQFRAKGRPSDGLYWQQQAILRTNPTPSALISINLNLWSSWRRRTGGTALRCAVQIILPLLYIFATLAATISTSYIVDTTNIEVLVQSPFCGRINNTKADKGSGRGQYQSTIVRLATPYRDQCYQDKVSLPAACRNIFIESRIPFSYKEDACPFGPGICMTKEKPAISMDTGLMDLNSHLGVNLMRKDVVKFRKRTTCAVIPMKNHYTIINSTRADDPTTDWRFDPYNDVDPGIPVAVTYLGGGLPVDTGLGLRFPNATFTVPLSRHFGTTGYSAVARKAYHNNDWSPLPELIRPDADTTISIFRLNTLDFAEPVDDPFFSAHFHMNVNATTHNYTIIKADYPVGAIGCTDQYQFCIAQRSGPDRCSQLSGLPSDITPDFLPGASQIQIATMQLLHSLSYEFEMSAGVAGGLKGEATVGSIPAMPSDQWAIEARWQVAYLLSMLQITFSDYALGPEVYTPGAKKIVDRASTDGEKGLCGAQKMRKAGGFANVNFFGLIFIIVVSSTLIIVDLSLMRILLLVRKYNARAFPRLDRWTQDSILQLQRRAFQAEGQGSWTNFLSEVPITRRREKLLELQSETYSISQVIVGEKGGDDGVVLSPQSTLAFDMHERKDTGRSLT